MNQLQTVPHNPCETGLLVEGLPLLVSYTALHSNSSMNFCYMDLTERTTGALHLPRRWLSGSLIIRNGLALPVNLSRILQNLPCLEITGYRIKYSTVLWLLELQIRRDRKVQTKVHTVNSNSQTSNCQCSLFSKKNSIVRIFCISGWLPVPINPDKWRSTVQ
jgi:hypothetical protein